MDPRSRWSILQRECAAGSGVSDLWHFLWGVRGWGGGGGTQGSALQSYIWGLNLSRGLRGLEGSYAVMGLQRSFWSALPAPRCRVEGSYNLWRIAATETRNSHKT